MSLHMRNVGKDMGNRLVIAVSLGTLPLCCERPPSGGAVVPVGKGEARAANTIRVLELVRQRHCEEDDKRQTALAELTALGARAVPSLVELMADPDSEVRSQAAWSLKDIGPPAKAAIPHLIESFGDEDRSVRFAAAIALGEISCPDGEPNPATYLMSTLVFDRPFDRPEARQGIVHTLGLSKPEAQTWTPALVRALSDETTTVRVLAVAFLREIGPPANSAVPRLLRVLREDKDPIVRRHGIRAVLSVGLEAKAGVPRFTEALEDDDSSVREEAVRALGTFGPDAVAGVPALVGLLKDEEVDAALVAEALGNVGPGAKASVAPLLERIRVDFQYDNDFAKAIGRIGIAAIPTLVKALSEENPDVVICAVSSLGEIGSDASVAVPELAELLKHWDPEVAEAAKRALTKIREAR